MVDEMWRLLWSGCRKGELDGKGRKVGGGERGGGGELEPRATVEEGNGGKGSGEG